QVEKVSETSPEKETVSEQDSGESTNFMFIEEVVEYMGQSNTVVQTDPILIPSTEKRPFKEHEEVIPIPSLPESIMVRYSENFPNLNIGEDSVGREWL